MKLKILSSLCCPASHIHTQLKIADGHTNARSRDGLLAGLVGRGWAVNKFVAITQLTPLRRERLCFSIIRTSAENGTQPCAAFGFPNIQVLNCHLDIGPVAESV
jgi:hypothetical protein